MHPSPLNNFFRFLALFPLSFPTVFLFFYIYFEVSLVCFFRIDVHGYGNYQRASQTLINFVVCFFTFPPFIILITNIHEALYVHTGNLSY